jgi:hypothetical protein
MLSAHEIKQKLSSVQSNSLSLDDFERWFASSSWNVHKDSSNQAIELVASIESVLSERNDFLLGANEVRVALLNFLKEQEVSGAENFYRYYAPKSNFLLQVIKPKASAPQYSVAFAK